MNFRSDLIIKAAAIAPVNRILCFILLLIAELLMPASGAGRGNENNTAVVGNPIVPGIGMADPHALVIGDKVYLYTGHDFSPENKGFVMKEWMIWSSSDLVSWKQEGTLQPEDTYHKGPSDNCWAGFCTTKNGKYYWYFSGNSHEIGMVVGDTPTGPWKDSTGKVMVKSRDPDAFIDDDGKAYLIYGIFNYVIRPLNEDMISFADEGHKIEIPNPMGPLKDGKTDDKPSLHKRNGIYYLSWSSYYATSPNIYGPYTYKDTIIKEENVAEKFRSKRITHDRHGNFFTFHNQWYYVCNDKSQPGRSGFFRDSIVSYLHYKDNGDMAPIRIDEIGVGQYDAAQSQIEAEDYFSAEGTEIKECPAGGFEVRLLNKKSRLDYPNINNLPPNAIVSFHVASANPGGGLIQIRDAAGKLLGSCKVPCTGGWNNYQDIQCVLHNNAGKKSLSLSFDGGEEELMRLDWLKFSPKP